ncbi:MAG: DUF5320 domain-containing protein [Chlorobi bacterium]|nr:DUF5320 domain-containing protein [Chlorobiota bacterium]
MPGLNSTGPLGQGPRTGRGLGKCNPRNEDSSISDKHDGFPKGKGLGRSKGKGLGRGRGRGRF